MNQVKSKPASVYSKSAHKSYQKDFYFPALGNKINVNFPFKKSLFFKQQPDIKKGEQNNQSKGEFIEQNPQRKQQMKNKSQNLSSANSFQKMIKKQELSPKNFSSQKSRFNKSAMYFTKRQLQVLQKTSIQHIQKKSKIQQRLIEKRESFQDFKKKKQMIRDEQKRKIFEDLQTRRLQRQRQIEIRQQQRQMQKIFVHQQNIAKIDMERTLKFRSKKEQIGLVKEKYIETEDNSHFLKMQNFKAKRNQLNLLESRLLFLNSNKIKANQDEDYLADRMTSRSFYGSGQLSDRKSTKESFRP